MISNSWLKYLQRRSRSQVRCRTSRGKRGAGFEPLESRRMLAADPMGVNMSALGASLSFEANLGQAPAGIEYLARANDYLILLGGQRATIGLSQAIGEEGDGSEATSTVETASLSMELVGANDHAVFSGVDQQIGRAHYYLGADPSQWITNVPTYGAVVMEEAWDGIDAMYYGTGAQLQYDFIVDAGADPSVIEFRLSDVTGLSVSEDGSLIIGSNLGNVVHHTPVIYQDVGDVRQQVAGRFVLRSDNSVGFEIATYDANHPLVIDPIISYSSSLFSGVNARNAGVKLDAAGNIYVAGDAREGFPTTAGAVQGTSASPGQQDGFVMKLDPTGTQVLYSTYLGGNWIDEINDLDVDSAGNVYVTGRTQSGSFPVLNALQPQINLGGGIMDAFVTRLDPNGQLVFSTYLGGSGGDIGYGIALDSAGDVYVTGITGSPDYIITSGALQSSLRGTADAFVTKLKGDGSAFVYSTYLGGSTDQDNAADIAVDADGNAYIVGGTQSTNFPVTPGAFQSLKSINSNNFDVFLTKLNPSGSSLVYSTYLGGAGNEVARAVAVDALGFAYVGGDVSLNVSAFPTTPGAYQTAATGPGGDMFVTKFALDASSLEYSTLLGGGVRRISGIDPSDNLNELAVDAAGHVYLVGSTDALDYPLVDPLRGFVTQSGDGVLTKLTADGSGLSFSTRLGGTAADGLALQAGAIYVVGRAGPLPAFDFFTPLTTQLPAPFGGEGSNFSYLLKITENLNEPPVLGPLGNHVLGEGDLLTFTASATDANPADVLVFSLVDAPATATMDPDTGEFYWMTDESHGPGSYTFTVQVSDGTATDEETITVTVDEIPSSPWISAGGPYVVFEGTPLPLAAVAGDADLPVDTQLVIEWDLDGDGEFGETGGLADRGDEVGANPTFAAGLDDGLYSVTARVTDATGLVSTHSTSITVLNRGPELASLAVTRFLDEGQTAILSGTLHDEGPDSLTLVVDWGDGSDLEQFTYVPGTTSFAETHVYADDGVFFVRVSLMDDDGDAFVPDLLVSNFVAAGRVHRFDGETGDMVELFVEPASGGLSSANDLAFGPDGNLYVASRTTNAILRYDGTSGAWLDEYASAGIIAPTGIVFGQDGHLYVASGTGDSVQRFDGQSGALLGDFVAAGSGGLNDPRDMVFGPDGHLYVISRNPNAVFRYDGQTGNFLDTFVAPGANGGLAFPQGMAFGENGRLYVGGNNGVFEYDASTGAFLRKFGTAGGGLAFGADGLLYASVVGQDTVLRYNVTSGQLVDTFVPSGSGGFDAPSFLAFFPTMATVVVANVAPSLTLNGDASADEGATYTLSLSASDPGSDSIAEWIIDWGDGTVHTVDGHPVSVSHVYVNDGNFTIRATAADEDDTYEVGNVIDVTVQNVAPTILSVTTDASLGERGSENEPVLLTLNFEDPGAVDEHTVVVDWGDGHNETFVLPLGNRQLVASHVYGQGGSFRVSASVSDELSGDAAISNAIVGGTGVVNEILWIVGTDEDDHVMIHESGRNTLRVHANFVAENGGRRIDLASVKSMVVLLFGGDDKLSIGGNVDLPALIDMGDGDDFANGGRGPTLMLGGAGKDDLRGSRGRNILIGGTGEDRIVGGSDNDVLFGGTFPASSDGELPFAADLLAAWRAWIDDESCRSKGGRTQPDRDEFFGFLSRLDDDGERDLLTGAAGTDWFLIHAGDKVTDVKGSKNNNVVMLF